MDFYNKYGSKISVMNSIKSSKSADFILDFYFDQFKQESSDIKMAKQSKDADLLNKFFAET